MTEPNHATHALERPCILIAEDDAASRGMLAEILQMHGMDTLEAGDGEEAVMLAFEWKPDAILLDLVMPVMDGIEAARAISADREIGGTPIIAMSGMLSEEMRRAAMDAGCAAYLQKPFAPSTIVSTIGRWLEASVRGGARSAGAGESGERVVGL